MKNIDFHPTRRSILAVAAGLFIVGGRAIPPAEPAHVMVVPCLHKAHLSNPNYTYQDLYDLVAGFRPDAVGVEIRQEDMQAGEDYLRRNYPAEMVYLNQLYGSEAFGFDWLGDELAGRRIPDDWWSKQSPIKKLEREMNASPTPDSPRLKALSDKADMLLAQQDRLVQTASASELADGRYDQITSAYNAVLDELTKGTRFAAYADFNAQRDAHIAQSIVAQIRARPGKRIAIVTGANHHGPVCKAIAAQAGLAELGPVPPSAKAAGP